MRLILASASPARLAVLRAAGVEPVVRVSGVDEDALAESLGEVRPEELVAGLAEAKARAVLPEVAADHPDCVIVGCDSMLAIDGEVVGKPGTVERARKRWAAMSGGAGVLLTGHAVVRVNGGRPAGTATGTERTTVRFGQPSERELEAYLATGEPLGVAGAFTLDGLGGWFVDGIDGDPSSVIGISLPLTRRLLARVGVSVVDVWVSRDGPGTA
ncbi:MAG TPA: Maf family protein [Actinophytocola sp.]|uniref:Maf family protein n=1 Tax=Actinophytocola sp. TaxID=1872138 RepID=UPI002DDD7E80|nr:Maf family protein [Actinophytocola sp.]HEV2784655.1 Maf family protein [Actinophytocola sp.]